MNPPKDPGDLRLLRDIVLPEPAPWWPLAPGWFFVIGLFLLIAAGLTWKTWARWKANAYRREALRRVEKSTDPREIATILKRTALSAFPRETVATLSGDAWCDWLEDQATDAPISPEARVNLARGVYGDSPDTLDLETVRRYAASWIQKHEAPTSC